MKPAVQRARLRPVYWYGLMAGVIAVGFTGAVAALNALDPPAVYVAPEQTGYEDVPALVPRSDPDRPFCPAPGDDLYYSHGAWRCARYSNCSTTRYYYDMAPFVREVMRCEPMQRRPRVP